MTATVEQRLLAGHAVAESGCWTWKRSLNSRGYGLISVAGKVLLAHRVAYETWIAPIPEGMTIDHLCRTKVCINPAHMEVVTREENARRGSPGTGKTHCLRGHELSGSNLIVKPRPNGRVIRNCRECRNTQQRAATFRRSYLDEVSA